MKEYQIYQISVIREQEARVAVDGLQFTVEKKQIPRFARDDMGRFSDVRRRER
jgi:pantothenate kinase